jgi:hypothetical protein
VNVVVDALSQRSHVNQLVVRSISFELCDVFNKLSLKIVANMDVMGMEVGSTLLQDILKGQLEDVKIQEIKRNIKKEKSPGFMKDFKELKDKILQEAHESAYFIHPRGNKMYHDLKATYWWYEIKRDIAEYVAICDICQRVKAKHQ